MWAVEMLEKDTVYIIERDLMIKRPNFVSSRLCKCVTIMIMMMIMMMTMIMTTTMKKPLFTKKNTCYEV